MAFLLVMGAATISGHFPETSIPLDFIEIFVKTVEFPRETNRFTADRRRRTIAESEGEGQLGISGRDSIRLFNKFYSTYARKDRLNQHVGPPRLFHQGTQGTEASVPEEFIESVHRL